MAKIALGWVQVRSIDPPLTVTARMSEERPDVTQGYGGWEEIARPRRSPLTTFRGSPGFHLTLPLLLDGWARGISVERDCSALEKMGRATAADGEPPRLRITARGSALPGQRRRWVIDTITWGEALMNKNGDRVRQFVTLNLIEYVEDAYLQEQSPATRRRTKAKRTKTARGAAKKRVTVKRAAGSKQPSRSRAASSSDFGTGEDLLTIAARELGDADRWVEIAELNGLRDPRAISPGQVLRLP